MPLFGSGGSREPRERDALAPAPAAGDDSYQVSRGDAVVGAVAFDNFDQPSGVGIRAAAPGRDETTSRPAALAGRLRLVRGVSTASWGGGARPGRKMRD
jgi:hypothetical protein